MEWAIVATKVLTLWQKYSMSLQVQIYQWYPHKVPNHYVWHHRAFSTSEDNWAKQRQLVWLHYWAEIRIHIHCQILRILHGISSQYWMETKCFCTFLTILVVPVLHNLKKIRIVYDPRQKFTNRRPIICVTKFEHFRQNCKNLLWTNWYKIDQYPNR